MRPGKLAKAKKFKEKKKQGGDVAELNCVSILALWATTSLQRSDGGGRRVRSEV